MYLLGNTRHFPLNVKCLYGGEMERLRLIIFPSFWVPQWKLIIAATVVIYQADIKQINQIEIYPRTFALQTKRSATRFERHFDYLRRRDRLCVTVSLTESESGIQ